MAYQRNVNRLKTGQTHPVFEWPKQDGSQKGQPFD
jgi:hypothetical protein